MQYAAHLPNTRNMLAPVVAFAIGAAGAAGAYAILDETDISVQPTRVVVADPPPQSTLSGKSEAATAAAIGSSAGIVAGKDEAATAAAVAPQTGDGVVLRRGGGPPAESSGTDLGSTTSRAEQLRSDPHGPAATLRGPQAR